MDASIRILHVDDDPDFAEVTAEFLEREDDRFVTVTETSADDGLARLATEEFDCIISDYQMPGNDGLEFLKMVRNDHPDLPFLLFTGRGSEEVASDAIANGATDYLQKQQGTEQYELLANRIRNAVHRSRTQRFAANLERIRSLVHSANQFLVRASSRKEIGTRVCQLITGSEFYRFAWIGEIDPDTDHVVPRYSAGAGDDYLDEIRIIVDESGPDGGSCWHGDPRTTRSGFTEC